MDSTVARNVLQNELGIDRARADWLVEHCEPAELETLSASSTPAIDVIRTIASDSATRIAAELALQE